MIAIILSYSRGGNSGNLCFALLCGISASCWISGVLPSKTHVLRCQNFLNFRNEPVFFSDNCWKVLPWPRPFLRPQGPRFSVFWNLADPVVSLPSTWGSPSQVCGSWDTGQGMRGKQLLRRARGGSVGGRRLSDNRTRIGSWDRPPENHLKIWNKIFKSKMVLMGWRGWVWRHLGVGRGQKCTLFDEGFHYFSRGWWPLDSWILRASRAISSSGVEGGWWVVVVVGWWPLDSWISLATLIPGIPVTALVVGWWPLASRNSFATFTSLTQPWL